MVYIGDSRARNPNRSWWNKPEINNMTEAMTSVGCRDQGKRWHDWCPGRPGLSSRRWSLREDATTGCKNELPCFLSFSHLLLCPQPPHVRPSRCQLTREPRKRGKAKKKKKRHWKANESNSHLLLLLRLYFLPPDLGICLWPPFLPSGQSWKKGLSYFF